jgi:hypothetical protein
MLGIERYSRDETPQAAKVKFASLRKDFAERGRGFSINQVQNGGTDSLCVVDLSARFALSVPKMATARECPLIQTGSDCPVVGFTSDLRANMNMIAFIPQRRPDFGTNGN